MARARCPARSSHIHAKPMSSELSYHSAGGKIHTWARIAAVGIGSLYLLVAVAVAIGMCLSAYQDRNNGPEAFGFANPLFYIALIVFTSLLAAMAWGFFWSSGGIARRQPRRVLLGKYLAMLNLALVALEAGGITVGLIADTPKGRDFQIALAIMGLSLFVLIALALTMWLLERSAKALRQ